MVLDPPSALPRYEWAPHEVGLYASIFVNGSSLEELLGRVYMLASENDIGCIRLAVCAIGEKATPHTSSKCTAPCFAT